MMFMRRVFAIGLILFGAFGLYTTYWHLLGMGAILDAISGNSSSSGGIYLLGIVSLFSFIYGFYIWNHRIKILKNFKAKYIYLIAIGILIGWIAASNNLLPNLLFTIAK